jgi:hypothetical protein
MTDYSRLSRVLSIAAIVCWGLPAWLSAAPAATMSGCGNPAGDLSAAGASARIAETTKPPKTPKPDKTSDEEEDCE